MVGIIDRGRRRVSIWLLSSGAAIATALTVMFSRGFEGTAADFYRVRAVHLVASSGAGGGYDGYAQLLPSHLTTALAGIGGWPWDSACACSTPRSPA